MPGDNMQNEYGDSPADAGNTSLEETAYTEARSIQPAAMTGGLTAAMHSGFGIESPFTREIFLGKQPIVGMRYQGGSDELVQDLEPGSRVTFLREPENRFDPDAVMALDEHGRKLGYIPRHENRIPGALLDAGKSLYGIATEVVKGRNYTGGGTPTVMYVDLYLREFAPPDGLLQIPRQGCRGSYAVLDLEVRGEAESKKGPGTDEGTDKILSVCAIKVINGEERGIFSESCPDSRENGTAAEDLLQGRLQWDASQEYMIRSLQSFIGYLPIVCHGITGELQKILEDAWGVYTGRAFSNQVIDVREMAKHHLNEFHALSLEELTDRLGIEIDCDTPQETWCRKIWRIYCRFDRSELGRKRDILSGKQSGNSEA
ncbi:MAG: hypothetical protein II640_07730 [Lachnospiraceae bacterium]|nr:hypothetical protein [Lachnospiraceae bacterium]